MNFLLQSFQISFPNSLTFIIPLCLFLFRLVFFRWSRRLPPHPPGPKGLPIIGNMLMMDQLTHRGLAKLSEQYGGIFHLRLGFAHMVVVSSPDVARQVLHVHDTVFSNRHASTAVNYLTYDRADMAFAHHGPFWLQMRKLFVTKLFNRKRKIVKDEVDSAVRAVMGRIGNAVNIGELVFGLTRNVIYRAAFGRSLKDGQDEFIGILHEFLKLFGEFNIADFIPYIGWIDPHGINSRLVRARESLDRFMDAIIDDRIEKKKKMEELNDGETDMVDDLLPFYSREAEANESADNSVKLTRDNIKALIMDVTFGGTETVASAIEWAMAELMRSPDELKKVQRELADVVGLDRRPEEGDFEKLTYLKCALKETLRLHPPIPLLLHESSEAAEVAGHHIPKKSRVMLNAWAIGRDKDSWEDPESFKPSRFLKQGAPDFKGSNFEFIPFGSGRRSCPGMHLGLYALELAVAHLIHCFAWELPDGMKPSELDMNDAFGVAAPRASRLIGVASRRVVCPL